MEPYKFWFVGTTFVFIGLGFWHVYFRPRSDCEDGSFCAKPQSILITKTVLWTASVIVLAAATIDWWALLFY
ncbi:MAG: hypothetical protein DHS20C06_03700 [Hyphobacterium sp.]|nr:MAG: hypothetical protein DHS20C06_03700 [Hyphobacterium sp.]